MKSLKQRFIDWLENKGYAKITPSGNRSTIYDYTARVNRISERNWEKLADNVLTYIHSETIAKKDKTALVKFNEFLYAIEFPREFTRLNIPKTPTMKAITLVGGSDTEPPHIKDEGKLYRIKDAAAFFGIGVDTMGDWIKEKRIAVIKCKDGPRLYAGAINAYIDQNIAPAMRKSRTAKTKK